MARGRFLIHPTENGPAYGGRARCWVVRGDLCGIISILVVWFFTLFIDFTVTKFTILPLYFDPAPTTEGWVHLVGFQLVIFVIFACHLTASFSDPGLVPLDNTDGLHEAAYNSLMERIKDTRPSDARALQRMYCQKCKIPKPKGVHHCSTCGRCVHRLDHHCPWINNCVAERNVKAFVLFLGWVAVGTAYSIVMIGRRSYQVFTQRRLLTHHHTGQPLEKMEIIIGLGVVTVALVASMFFLLFVLFMCYDQYEAATTGLPGIDALQGVREEQDIPLCRGLAEFVCREPWSWHWLVPLPPPLPPYPVPKAPGQETEENDKKEQ